MYFCCAIYIPLNILQDLAKLVSVGLLYLLFRSGTGCNREIQALLKKINKKVVHVYGEMLV